MCIIEFIKQLLKRKETKWDTCRSFSHFFLTTLYSIIMPFDTFEISHIFENIMENGAFALFGANAPFSRIFSKVFKSLLQCCLKIENDVII